MPPAPKTVQHHPSSLNNLLLQSLLDRTSARNFLSFLTKDLSSVTKPVAQRLIAELAGGDNRFEPDMHPSEVRTRAAASHSPHNYLTAARTHPRTIPRADRLGADK